MVRLVAVALLAGLLLAGAAPSALAEGGSMIRSWSGPVEVQKAGLAIWAPARNGLLLDAGDTVRTLQGGRCELALAGGRVVRLDGDTTLTIPVVRYNTPQSVGLVRLLVGTLWAAVEDLRLGSRFGVATPNALGGVKGTLFWASFHKLGARSTFGVVRGRVQVTHFGSNAPGRTLEPGHECDVSAATGLSPLRRFDPVQKLRLFEGLAPVAPEQRGEALTAPGNVSDLLREEARLLASMRKLDAGVRRQAGSATGAPGVTGLPAEAQPKVTALSSQILEASRRNGGRLRLFLGRGGARTPAGQQALREYSSMHQAIMDAHGGLTGQGPGSGRRTGPAPSGRQPTEPAERRGSATFLRQALFDLGAVARKAAAVPTSQPVPPALVRTYESVVRDTDRRWGSLEPKTTDDQAMWNDYLRAKARTASVVLRRTPAARAPVTGAAPGDLKTVQPTFDVQKLQQPR